MHALRVLALFALLPLSTQAANPIFAAADPHAAVFDGTLWIYPTHSEGGRNFWAWKQTPQKTWEKTGPVLDFKDVPWLKSEHGRNNQPWAPCIIEKSGRYYFYYSVGPQSADHPSRIGVAEGGSPHGPFKDSGKALLTGGNGFEAIDPMVFEDPASRRCYFYAGGSAGAKLRVFELASGMTSFKEEAPIEQPRNFTEGAFMHFQGGFYHLTYSHGNWKDATYSVHHSTSKSPTGPWQYRSLILKSDDRHKGPGHHSIVRLPGTENWLIIYHRWNQRQGDGPYSGPREVAVERLTHGKDGAIEPVVMTD